MPLPVFFNFKKMRNFILFIGLLVAGVANAQVPVWINTFDTPADLQGWTIHDVDGNNNSWTQGKNHVMMNNGTEDVLRYSWLDDNNTMVTGYQTDNDWIISPEIDLTNASGAITFAAYISRGNPNSSGSLGRTLYIYESTTAQPVPTLADFQDMALDANGMYDPSYPYQFSAGTTDNPWVTPNTDFNECLVDISAFAGKKIYFALWTYSSTDLGSNNGNQGMININEIGIYADNVASTQDFNVKNSISKLYGNPVESALSLELNPQLMADQTTLTVYNLAGQKVLSAKYSESTDVSTLGSGMYILHLTDGKISERLKFIKK